MDLSNIRVNTYFGIFQLVLSVALQPYNGIYPIFPAFSGFGGKELFQPACADTTGVPMGKAGRCNLG
jgi:hypothetical protein